jgi:hypothetical protein
MNIRYAGGYTIISARIDGRLVEHYYLYYSLREAKARFRAEYITKKGN